MRTDEGLAGGSGVVGWAGALLCMLSAAMIIVVGSSGLSGDYAVASTGVPSAPSELTASWSGSTISLSWNNPGDDSIDKYQYQITTGRRHSNDNWVDIGSSGPSTTSHTINGVTGLGHRHVHLRSHNSNGNSVVATIRVDLVAVKLLNSGTGKCLDTTPSVILQWACHAGPNQRFRFYPISDMSGFFQIKSEGKCVEESSTGLLVAAPCAMRARGESAAAFEARLSRQAFGFGPSSGSGAVVSSYAVGFTYTLRRKGVSGSCWTIPGTVAVPPWGGTRLTSESCDGSWGSQRWVVVGDVTFASPAAVKLSNVGTGKCLDSSSSLVFQWACESVHHQRFRFYPISGSPGFFQVESVGIARCVEESQAGLVTAPCAVRARGESAAAFEARLSRQAFGFGPSSGSGAVVSSYAVGFTYTLRRKGVSGSCWTIPGTVAVPPWGGTRLTSESCDGSWGSQRWVVVGDVTFASPAAVKLSNVGTGKCVSMGSVKILQSSCAASSNQQFRFYPISGSPGFFQVEVVGRSKCVEESPAGLLVTASCAVRARGESSAAFETRLLKQAFQKVTVAGASDTYTLRRKGVSGSCWTVPGTVAVPPRDETQMTNASCDSLWGSQRWFVRDASFTAPVPVKLSNVGTGKCATMGSAKVFQWSCFASSNQRFRFYPISGMAGFFQVEGVGRGKCVEESPAGLLVTASCAVRARGETAAAFETRLSRQAFGFGPSSGSGAVASSYAVGFTYTLRRQRVSGSCWTVPGTVAAPPRDETQITNASCDGSRNSQWTLRDASYTTTTTQSG